MRRMDSRDTHWGLGTQVQVEGGYTIDCNSCNLASTFRSDPIIGSSRGKVLTPPEVLAMSPGVPLEQASTEGEILRGEVMQVLDYHGIKEVTVYLKDIIAA